MMDVWTVISVLQAFPPDQCGERHSPTPKRYLAKKVKLYIFIVHARPWHSCRSVGKPTMVRWRFKLNIDEDRTVVDY